MLQIMDSLFVMFHRCQVEASCNKQTDWWPLPCMKVQVSKKTHVEPRTYWLQLPLMEAY